MPAILDDPRISVDGTEIAPENDFSDLEDSVSKIDDVEKRLDGRITQAVVGAWAVVTILLGWLGVGTNYLISIHGDIQAIKQYEKDHGGEIVRNIENPKNTSQLTANLSLLAAQLQVARSEHRPPDSAQLTSLQSALVKASTEHPELPETWQAAVQLVDYKYQSESSPPQSPPNCLDRIGPRGNDILRNKLDGRTFSIPPAATDESSTGAIFHLEDCALSLDDSDFYSTALGKAIAEKKAHNPAIVVVLQISNALVTYSGGKIVPVNRIEFKNCTFDISQPILVPDKPSQAITTQLLAANRSEGIIQLHTTLND